jgi:hypothetical protein
LICPFIASWTASLSTTIAPLTNLMDRPYYNDFPVVP